MFVPVAKTSIDWSTLLEAGRKATSRSVTASLDGLGMPMSEAASLLCVLAEFGKSGGDALRQIRTDTGVKRHFQYSFLVTIPRAQFLSLAAMGLTVTPAEFGDAAIVSARLNEWVPALVDGSNHDALREFSCRLLAWFEREGLGEAWSAWEKDHLPGGLYQMVKK